MYFGAKSVRFSNCAGVIATVCLAIAIAVSAVTAARDYATYRQTAAVRYEHIYRG